jgi:hypothetical protein
MLLLTVLEFVLTTLLIAFLGIYLVYASTFHPLCFSFQRPFQQFCLGDNGSLPFIRAFPWAIERTADAMALALDYYMLTLAFSFIVRHFNAFY